jgi:hypothetical protein
VHVDTLALETDRRRHEVVFDDLSVPDSVKPLLAFLRERSHDLFDA